MLDIGKAAAMPLLSLAFLLVGCGGGGGVESTGGPGGGSGSSGGSSGGSSYTRYDDLQGDQTFQTAGVVVVTIGGGTGPLNSHAMGEGAPARYFVKSDEIEVQANGFTYRFGPSDFSRSSSTATVDVYEKADETLLLTVPQAGGVNLSYTRLGRLITKDRHYQDYVVFGVNTKASDMPKSGSASYAASVYGSAEADGRYFQLDKHASATFTADFGAGTVQTSLNLRGARDLDGAIREFAKVDGRGTINSATAGFSGNFNGYGGMFEGGFFGPKASEMGYAFATGDGIWTAYGHVAGKKL